MNFSAYPFDVQTCPFMIGSTGQQIDTVLYTGNSKFDSNRLRPTPFEEGYIFI